MQQRAGALLDEEDLRLDVEWVAVVRAPGDFQGKGHDQDGQQHRDRQGRAYGQCPLGGPGTPAQRQQQRHDRGDSVGAERQPRPLALQRDVVEPGGGGGHHGRGPVEDRVPPREVASLALAHAAPSTSSARSLALIVQERGALKAARRGRTSESFKTASSAQGRLAGGDGPNMRGAAVRQRLNFVTIGVRDLGASRRFYLDGLGWEPTLDLPEVVFLQVGHGLLLGLWPVEEMEADVPGTATGRRAEAGSGAPFTLAHNVDSDQAVVEALEAATAAGATILKPAQRAGFGGFHGYFADPDGVRWEVAHNPGWRVADDGRVTLVPIED